MHFLKGVSNICCYVLLISLTLSDSEFGRVWVSNYVRDISIQSKCTGIILQSLLRQDFHSDYL